MPDNVKYTEPGSGTEFSTYDVSDAHVQLMLGGTKTVVTQRVNYTASQTNTAILTPASGKRLVITRIGARADNANTAFPSVLLGLHSTTTPTGTGAIDGHPGIPAGGGFTSGDGSGILAIGAANDKLLVTMGAPTGGSVSIFVTYFEI